MVGVEGLEAGLGRAVEGAGDTEAVVQNLQLTDGTQGSPEHRAGWAVGRQGGGRGGRETERAQSEDEEKNKTSQ